MWLLAGEYYATLKEKVVRLVVFMPSDLSLNILNTWKDELCHEVVDE